jgi:dienelactone hydrolase
VSIGRQSLAGELTLVPDSRGLVVFADDCAAIDDDPHHRFLADVLHDYRLDTLQFGLLTAAEAQDRERVFDIELLAQRLAEGLRWARADGRGAGRGTGLFGACSGAAAALRVAAQHPGWVAAVALRGGRPDLAAPWLARVLAPTLLMVGGQDGELLGLNRAAARSLRCDWRLEVVPGATRRFEESGAIETVGHLAGTWFGDRLRLPVH